MSFDTSNDPSFDAPCALPLDPLQLSAEQLTDLLRQSGTLPGGRVIGVEVEAAEKWHVAERAFLTLDYDAEAPADAPRRLLAKLNTLADPFGDLFEGEAAFYARTMGADLPIPRCHAAVREPGTPVTLILLEDLRRSHQQPPWNLPPRLDECRAAVETLAAMHAHDWLAAGDPKVAAVQSLGDGIARVTAPKVPDFLNYLGDRLTGAQRRTFANAIDSWPALRRNRVSSGLGLTLCHGDPHFWNFLYPNDPHAGTCVLFDWEDWSYDLAAADLARMIALFINPPLRQRIEAPLLEAYRAALAKTGIEHDADALWHDYRLAHLCHAGIPLIQWDLGISADVWWPHLERWFLAYEDLGCADLMRG